MNKLVILSAPSGAGKTTFCSRLLRDIPGMQLSISTTTRAPRGREVHGKDYFFVTQDTFQTMIQNAEFAEWAEVHGNYYGTSRSFVETAVRKGHILFDIDVQGAESLRTLYPDNTVSIFIAPPSMEELERRLRGRGTDSDAVIERRMNAARKEMAEAHRFTRTIINDDLEKAYADLLAWLTDELAR